MQTFWLAAASALWLGIQTSLSPCPLASNLAAISYIGRRVGSSRQVFWTGVLYTAGRTAVYLTLGVLLVASVLSVPRVSLFLQNDMNRVLGPVLILVAMLLLGMLGPGVATGGINDAMRRRVEALGVWGAGLLGIIFALSFCPVSAALFFGSLIPLSIRCGSRVAVPAIYGIGTAVPVVVFAALLAINVRWLATALHCLAPVERWARRLTGGVFLALGLHYALKYSIGIRPFWDPWLDRICRMVW